MKSLELEVLEKVSRSISVVGIVSISTCFLLIILTDLTRYFCKVEPLALYKQRQLDEKQKLLKNLRTVIQKLVAKYKKLDRAKQNPIRNFSSQDLTENEIASNLRYKYIDDSISGESSA